MKNMLLIAAAFAAAASCAKVAPDENIILNGRFDSDQMEVPPFWHVADAGKSGLVCDPSGGPGGVPSVKFANPGPEVKSFILRQFDLTLVPGAKYRLSAKIRTRDFSSKHAGFMVINAGWHKTVSVGAIAPTQDWKSYTRDVVMVPSKDEKAYSVALYAGKCTGEIEVADVRLEALDDAACAGSCATSSAGDPRQPRFVPMKPLLARIPRDRREVLFRLYGVLPGAAADYDVVLTAEGAPAPTRRALREGDNLLPLPDGAREGKLSVALVRRADGQELLREHHRFAVVDVPAQAVDSGRRLNNLVIELVNEQVVKEEATYSFSLANDAWVFISAGKAGASVQLDGRAVIDGEALRGETFRQTKAGSHTLTVKGNQGAKLVARKVPDIFNYPVCVNSHVKENGLYDWAFAEKHVFPASNTQNGGRMPDEKIPLFHRRGGVWFANLGTTSIADGDDLVRRLKGSPGITDARYDGVTCDEQFFGKPGKIADYAKGLKAFNADYTGDHIVYTWIVGKSATPGVDQEFASACANASRGRGRMISEIYCRTKPTEAAAREYLDDYLTGTMTMFAELFPEATKSTGIILGNFNQVPVISLHHHPEVDYKYYLDLQLNIIANNPAFRDLGCTGYWGSYYADRELHIWSMQLLRHYCVEGHTAMLSDKYGYTYLPGHLTNGDFRESLDGWSVTGAVTREEVAGFGDKSERRWGRAGGIGDAFATLTKKSGQMAMLVQQAKGLVPGRLYCLQGCVFDAQHARARLAQPRRIELELETGAGAEVLPALTWRHIDRRVDKKHKDGAFVNLVHVVFRATAPEATVRISNAAAPDGSELGVNYVSLNPYHPED